MPEPMALFVLIVFAVLGGTGVVLTVIDRRIEARKDKEEA